MRVGIIGAGVSGMTAAWLLQHDHEVTLMDKEPRFGGHVETVPVAVDGKVIHAELGARFFFDSAYPYFIGLLRLLEVPITWNDAHVSFRDESHDQTIVVPPQALRHYLALARSPRLTRHVLSLRRLVREQSAIAAHRDFSTTLRAHLARNDYPSTFGPEFVFPFLAACWGAPLSDLPEFPIYSLLKGMPRGERPGFYEIDGGMERYVSAFARELDRVTVRMGTGITRVERRDAFLVEDERGEVHAFDRLVIATSSRDASSLLHGVPGADEMRAAVSAFRHFEVETVVHGDRSFMPADPRDWCHNNLILDGGVAWMTDWQGIREDAPVFRSWLPKGHAPPTPIYARRSYHHLVMTPENALLQRRIAAVQGDVGLWVTGMYAADVDNHESALLSAIVPALALAPRSRNLARLLAVVPNDAPHGLDVLPPSRLKAA